jgi:hypothetical protein
MNLFISPFSPAPVTPSLLGPNILLNTLNLFSFLSVRSTFKKHQPNYSMVFFKFHNIILKDVAISLHFVKPSIITHHPANQASSKTQKAEY